MTNIIDDDEVIQSIRDSLEDADSSPDNEEKLLEMVSQAIGKEEPLIVATRTQLAVSNLDGAALGSTILVLIELYRKEVTGNVEHIKRALN